MQVLRRLLLSALVVGSASACTDTDSATNLNPEGPPMLRQVRLNHRVFDATNPAVSFPRRIFAFGTHELAAAEEVKADVNTAIVLNNEIRLIVDELLVGNNLEEIACRGNVDDDNFARVPLGSNPDDISRCAVADDALGVSCGGATAVCMCQNELGCTRDSGVMVALGEPVGVRDANQDGAVDDMQFIAGAVRILCGAAGSEIDVPISLNGDLTGSYWNPSGDQNRPAQGGFDALGPAIVLKTQGPMPTNLPCQLSAAEAIVDKENRRLCAPPNGDVAQPCTEGDMSAFQFRTEALSFTPASWTNGETGVSRTNDATFAANAPLNTPAGGSVTVKEGAANFTNFTFALDATKLLVNLTWTATLAAQTTYEVTFTPTIVDTFAQGLPAPQSFTFTTGDI